MVHGIYNIRIRSQGLICGPYAYQLSILIVARFRPSKLSQTIENDVMYSRRFQINLAVIR